MKQHLQLLILFLSPLILSASGDTLKPKSAPIKRWNITVSAGYGFPFSKQVLGGVGTVDSNSTTVSKVVRGTFGKGMFSFLSVGYKINQHFGSELGIHSTRGERLITSKVSDVLTGHVYQERYTQVSTKGIFAGIFMTDTYSKLHVSFHNDLLIGVRNYATEETFSNGARKPIWKCSGGISCGWLSRIGASYDIFPNMNIGVSGFFLMHRWSPKRGETIDGGNKITFPDNSSSGGFYNVANNQWVRETYPLHTAGVNLSLTFNF
jgi:hypothetical protein